MSYSLMPIGDKERNVHFDVTDLITVGKKVKVYNHIIQRTNGNS